MLHLNLPEFYRKAMPVGFLIRSDLYFSNACAKQIKVFDKLNKKIKWVVLTVKELLSFNTFMQ